jgi:hypothetical protein
MTWINTPADLGLLQLNCNMMMLACLLKKLCMGGNAVWYMETLCVVQGNFVLSHGNVEYCHRNAVCWHGNVGCLLFSRATWLAGYIVRCPLRRMCVEVRVCDSWRWALPSFSSTGPHFYTRPSWWASCFTKLCIILILYKYIMNYCMFQI